MLVVDSCCWIEWIANGPRADDVAKHLTAPSAIIVPTLVAFEVHKWLARERGENVADAAIGALRSLTVVDLDLKVALLASELGRQHQLATADSIVLAHARLRQARVLTLDAHLGRLPDAIFYSKAIGPVP